MTTSNEKRIAAGERYAAAVRELREAFGELTVFDETCRTPSFGGPQPDVITLQHPIFAPDVAGSFADDVVAARARLRAE